MISKAMLMLMCLLPLMGETSIRVVLEPLQKTTLSSQVSSTVLEIHKKLGQRFEKGDPLITLDAILFQAELQKANSEKIASDAELDAQKRLHEDRVASFLDLKRAEAKAMNAEAEVTIARKKVHDSFIKAPYSGKVEKVLVKEFELVQAGEELMQIVEDTTLQAKMLIPVDQMSSVEVGKKIEIFVNEIGKPVEAIISHVGAVFDPASSLLMVHAEIDNAEGNLRGGMTGVVKL